jgi:hypothetical protein
MVSNFYFQTSTTKVPQLTGRYYSRACLEAEIKNHIVPAQRDGQFERNVDNIINSLRTWQR